MAMATEQVRFERPFVVSAPSQLERARRSFIIGVLGDIHGNFKEADKIMQSEPDVPAWVCTGDVSDANNKYFTPIRPLHFVLGNHEGWDEVEKMEEGRSRIFGLNLIMPTKSYNIGGVTVVGFGRNYAPRFLNYERKNLPHPREGEEYYHKKDHRRHFVKDDIDAFLKLSETVQRPHLLLTHEAPKCFYEARRRGEIGTRPISDNGVGTIIESFTKAFRPVYHIAGHHHIKYERFISDTRTKFVCMPYAREEYLLIDFSTMPPTYAWKPTPQV
jgi:hypothetical protein